MVVFKIRLVLKIHGRIWVATEAEVAENLLKVLNQVFKLWGWGWGWGLTEEPIKKRVSIEPNVGRKRKLNQNILVYADADAYVDAPRKIHKYLELEPEPEPKR
jgi:hypothetical protein